MKSKTQATIDGLIALGWSEIEGRSTRARTFTNPESKYKCFVGKGGSIRVGPMKTKSLSYTDSPFHLKVLKAGL